MSCTRAGSCAKAVPSWSTNSRPRATGGSLTRSRRLRDGRRGSSLGGGVAWGRRVAVPGAAEPFVRRATGGLSGFIGDIADAGSGDRGDDVVLHALARVGPPGRVPARGRGDRPVL